MGICRRDERVGDCFAPTGVPPNLATGGIVELLTVQDRALE